MYRWKRKTGRDYEGSECIGIKWMTGKGREGGRKGRQRKRVESAGGGLRGELKHLKEVLNALEQRG